MRTVAALTIGLLLTGCGPQNPSGPAAKVMRDDVGGRLFFIQSNEKHDGKRSSIIIACHGDGDNIVMFKTGVPLTEPPAVSLDYRVGRDHGQAAANWTGNDVWTFSDSRFSRRFATLVLQNPDVAIRFPAETGAPHAATWSLSTAADFRDQMRGWCLKPAR